VPGVPRDFLNSEHEVIRPCCCTVIGTGERRDLTPQRSVAYSPVFSKGHKLIHNRQGFSHCSDEIPPLAGTEEIA